MAAPTLTQAEALADYGLTCSTLDIADAAEVIHADTGFTLAEHVDTRTIYIGNVRRAWAVVASRVAEETSNDSGRSVTGETEKDYSYSESVTLKSAQTMNFLAGTPNKLLRIVGRWSSFSEQAALRASESGDRGIPPTLDDNGTPFA
jgi:hypothetical protein